MIINAFNLFQSGVGFLRQDATAITSDDFLSPFGARPAQLRDDAAPTEMQHATTIYNTHYTHDHTCDTKTHTRYYCKSSTHFIADID